MEGDVVRKRSIAISTGIFNVVPTPLMLQLASNHMNSLANLIRELRMAGMNKEIQEIMDRILHAEAEMISVPVDNRLGKTQREIVMLLESSEAPMHYKQIMEQLKLSDPAARSALSRLSTKGTITARGHGLYAAIEEDEESK